MTVFHRRQILIACLFLLSVLVSFADDWRPYSASHQPVTITGRGQRGYRVPFVSAEIRNNIFLQEQGQLFLPERGFFLDLDEASAQKMGRKTILIIPINNSEHNSEIWYNYDKDITMDIYPMTGSKTIYYTKDDKLLFDGQLTNIAFWNRFLTQPSSRDTVPNRAFLDRLDTRFLTLLIEQMDNDMSVINENVLYETKLDRCGQLYYYDTVSLSSYVREVLSKVWIDRSLGGPSDRTSAEAWRQWITALPESKLENPNYNGVVGLSKWKPSYNSYGNSNNELFIQDPVNKDMIYGYNKEGVERLNVAQKEMTSIPHNMPGVSHLKWKQAEEENKYDFIEKWADEESILSYRYITLRDKRILLSAVSSNGFNELAYLYCVDPLAPDWTKKISYFSTIPLTNSSDDMILIQALFETDQYYCVVVSVESTCYWNVFEKDIINQ